ncbi:MAG: hypothetical protein A2504_07310 [Bdellovibrionales bacterium RIFOXYD12_FULL_39_22]|nr:MAG: hypothetical protein A2385_16680 [Bdellovibrionales bacterium RIFOXYB1_FULL_39_21]OFZ44686.1 MAG: hypothetical protein A2485_14540 [Bdellovibrionales bacterium RIFOXYC12_FULL_39_17]OFZ49316.1 MAG: hypothetical protein A2404_08835 [Bdellovibrionales bacterium RIFOXYC1_FULL_39_130]OFZ77052.1 MAG: hypothetical protein A2560_09800 [Bdellovibrionales bacterium RIFOXYD1_FULL_39_84]OFZ95312.1 MAG: hypothetical protein A2504_07310 [Bdellovibrionales bacterium RIFOXYD12_FULL_39_22]HLE13072.1 hy
MSILSGRISQITTLDMSVFQHQVEEMLTRGMRLVSFFASPIYGFPEIFLNALLADDRYGKLQVLRVKKSRDSTYPSFTKKYSTFHCFEREICEQYKITPEEHPWPKRGIRYPNRKGSGHLGQFEKYPFFKLEGKEVHEVGVGPIHAGVIEPGHFRFMCYGEMVHHLEIQLGYQHRHVESLLLRGEMSKLAPLVETIAGDSSIAHTWAYCRAYENLCVANIVDLADIELVRGVALELERIAMHLAGLSGLSTDIAFLPGGSTYGRLRTAIINTSMRLGGSRFGRGWLRPGEVRSPITKSLIDEVRIILSSFKQDIDKINDLFLSSKLVANRFCGVGVVTKEVAIDIGAVGMAARMSGVVLDLRQNFASSNAPYDKLPIVAMIEESGDCWARACLRIREINESLYWINSAFDEMERKDWKLQLKIELKAPQSNAYAISLIEGWRGEVMHYLETGPSGKLAHYKVQDPSIRNWFALAQSLRGNEISDFPICNKSFDLSYCGNDL